MILFISGNVGVNILQFIRRSGDVPSILVLDRTNRDNMNDILIQLSGVNGASIIYSDDLYKEETLDKLRSSDIDLGFLVWWPDIIRNEIIDIVNGGIINIHPSYVPYNRGKDPNFWALLDGTQFGATLHYIDTGIDSGDIIDQEIIPVDWEDTGQTLYHRSIETLLRLFKYNYSAIKSGKVTTRKQNNTIGNTHSRKDLELASKIEIDKPYTARQLLNLIRAKEFNPHPHAWFEDDGKEYEVSIKITNKFRG